VADFAVYVLGTIFQQVLTFVAGIIIAHSLGPSGYGVTGLLRNFTVLALVVAPLGADLSLLRFLNETGDDPARRLRSVGVIRLIVGCWSSLLMLLMFGAAALLGRSFYKIESFMSYATVAFVALPFMADIAVLGATFRGLRSPIYQNIANLFFQPVLRLCLLSVFMIFHTGIAGAILSNTLAVAGAWLVLELLMRVLVKKIGPRPSPLPNFPEIKELFKYSGWLCALLFLYSLIRNIDIPVLAKFVSPSQVGNYAATAVISQIVLAFPQALSQTLGPRISRLYHEGRVDAVREAVLSYLRNAVLIASPVAAALATFAPWLDVIFGARFHFERQLSVTLTLAYYLAAIFAPMGYCLSMTGKHIVEFFILLLGAIVTVISLMLLVPRFGPTGAAAGIALGYLTVESARTFIVSKLMGFVPGRLRDLAPLPCCFAAAIAISMIFSSLGIRHSLLAGAGMALVYLGAVSAIYSLFLLSRSEKIFVLERVSSLRQRLGVS
jgi:O-antigen/teichoic acid export membrane protein